jgi:23S rRNA (cytidine1920-2'-O)/16S rRNA (cytidine1409-2'-O)-methyltransferase
LAGFFVVRKYQTPNARAASVCILFRVDVGAVDRAVLARYEVCVTRLDQYLIDTGRFQSRARAQAAIRAGLVRIGGAVAQKPSQKVASGARVEIDGEVHPYVSRGGVKLAAALRAMEIDPAGKICLDLGASTGGFSDVLLRRGATKVYAVDVGTGQLDAKIAADPRVVNLQQTHARDLSPALIGEPIDIIVCDVSFISLRKALPPALALGAPGARLAALVKPQFEVGRSQIGKGGIVKPGIENSVGVAQSIGEWLAAQPGWRWVGYMKSPISGGDGNVEFLLGAIKSA